MKRYSWRTVLVANLALIVLALLMSEILLQLGSAWRPEIDRATGGRWYAPFLPDKAFGVKGNPRYPGHDFRGFRNAGSMEKAAIVAMGSSHTYGEAVSQPWPTLLSQALGKPVYNMATPSSGLSYNYQNLSTALELEPKLVIVDLAPLTYIFDFKFVKTNGTLARFTSMGDLEIINNLEQQNNIETEDAAWFGDSNVPQGSTGQAILGMKQFMKDHSRVYGLLRAIKRQASGDDGLFSRDFDQAKRSVMESQLSTVLSVFDGPDWKTILNTPRRLNVINNTDVRIKVGLEISKVMLKLISDDVKKSGADFAVLLLPTKEYVFWPKVDRPEQHKGLTALIQNEERLRSEMLHFMEENAIDYIDPAPALRASPSQPYFSDADGHPNTTGHEIITEEIVRYLKRSNEGQLQALVGSKG
jgi:hypothetical protein